MRPALLTEVLEGALLHGNHSPDCAFEKARRAGRFLPSRHPAKPTEAPDIGLCDCWVKKARRLLRDVAYVQKDEIVNGRLGCASYDAAGD